MFVTTKNLFFSQNLPTTNARWPIKGSKDADFFPSLFLKERTSKLLLEFFSQALITSWKIHDITPQKVQTQKCPDFLIKARRLSTSLEGLISSLALPVGKLWLDKVQATEVALRSLKVLSILFHLPGLSAWAALS